MKSKVLIEKNKECPMPRTSQSAYPFEIMEIGDSFSAGKYSRESQQVVAAYINAYEKRSLGKKFVTRKVENLLKVWRTA